MVWVSAGLYGTILYTVPLGKGSVSMSGKVILHVLIAALLISSCTESGGSEKNNTVYRPYRLGFTPFPYDVSAEAVEYSYDILNTDADITAHHFDDGIPWPEALAGTDYHANVMGDWKYRKENTPAGHSVYVAVTPINLMRDGLAPYRGETGDMPLPSPWDTYAFNHEDVKKAYLNYCVKVIDYFNPDYFCIGIEVNLLMHHAKSKWNAFVELHRYVYGELKALYPDRVVMVSFTGMDLIDGYTDSDYADQMTAFQEVIDYSDYYGLSLHIFISSLADGSLPDSVFEDIFSLSSKPLGICETSYPAESFSVYGGSITFAGSEEKQDDFFKKLFSFSDVYAARFVINFVIRDYDALWESIGSPDDFTKLWRDTGLYDENGTPRIARNRWIQKLNLPVDGK
jgi:hypothetical protein